MGLLNTEFAGATLTPVPVAEQIRKLEVFVLFTDIPATLAALRTAAQLAHGLAASIRLLVLQIVPYPLPLTEPPRNLRFLAGRFRTVVDSCSFETASRSVDTTAGIVLCRDACDALNTRLGQSAVVVIGRRSRWWPHREDRWARHLRAAGHHVVRTSVAHPPFAPAPVEGRSHA